MQKRDERLAKTLESSTVDNDSTSEPFEQLDTKSSISVTQVTAVE